jgi:shikimate kinase
VLITSGFCKFEGMKNVFLVGYMGVGKTTIGKKLARILSMEFVDLDLFMEQKLKLSITQIMDQFGEPFFRELEQKSLVELNQNQNQLIATGGGTPCFFGNMTLMNANGATVYLKMDDKSIVNRLKNNQSTRPLIKGLNAEQLSSFVTQHLASRRPYYESAHFVLEALNVNAEKLQSLSQEIKLI